MPDATVGKLEGLLKDFLRAASRQRRHGWPADDEKNALLAALREADRREQEKVRSPEPEQPQRLPGNTQPDVLFAAMEIAERYCCTCPEDQAEYEPAHVPGCPAPLAVSEMLAGPLRNWTAPTSGQPSLPAEPPRQQEGRR